MGLYIQEAVTMEPYTSNTLGVISMYDATLHIHIA